MNMMKWVKPKEIYKLFRISRQQLNYWRKVGLFTASVRTVKGHYLYQYKDVVALKTISTLKDNGFSIQHIKKVYLRLKKRHKDIENPFVQKSIIIIDKRIAYIHNEKLYDAITGQGFLFEVISSEEIEFNARADINKKAPKLIKETATHKNRKLATAAKKKVLRRELNF